MAADRFQFEDFTLDPVDRRLFHAGQPVELGSRYFDALLLLLGEPGKLVSKDRFMDEIWHGVPVTDEALTQCVRTLRRQLGDDAAKPRFIETVPKHGYRFIGPVQRLEGDDPAVLPAPAADRRWARFFLLGGAGTMGGGMAGIAGGLLYGFGLNAGQTQAGLGATSVLFVLLALNMLVGLVGGAGVGFGVAAADLLRDDRWQWSLLGGGIGGFVTGAAARLIGLDAFSMFLGHSPEDMTGAAEGAFLGAAVGFAAWLARRRASGLGTNMAIGGLAAGIAGFLVSLFGGKLLGGSLDLLLNQFPHARLRLDSIGAMFGETGFGPVSRIVTSGIEGALFGACILGAFFLARQALEAKD